MTINDIEQAIREYILDIYKREYVGKIKVDKLDPIGYMILLTLSSDYHPLVIYAEIEDSKFLKFLKEELRNKPFLHSYYGKLDLVYPYTDCYDQRRVNAENR